MGKDKDSAPPPQAPQQQPKASPPADTGAKAQAEEPATHVEMDLKKTVSVRGHTFFKGTAQVPVKLVDAVKEAVNQEERLKRQADDEPVGSKKGPKEEEE